MEKSYFSRLLPLFLALIASSQSGAFFVTNLDEQIKLASEHPKARFEIARNKDFIVFISAAKIPKNEKGLRWWHLWLYEPDSEWQAGKIHFSLEKDAVLLIGMSLKEHLRGQGLSYFMINLLYQFTQRTGRNFETVSIKKPVLIKVLSDLFLKPKDTDYPFYICGKGKGRGIYADFSFPSSFAISQGINILQTLPMNPDQDCDVYFAHTSYVLSNEDEDAFLRRLSEKYPT